MARRPGRPKLNTNFKRTGLSTTVKVSTKKYIEKELKKHGHVSLGKTVDMLIERLKEIDNIS